MAEEQDGLSIGALARATGISIHSLRMWERRYGAPQSIRRASGHRRYPYAEVARLRAVARALGLGFRAGEIAHQSLEEINRMIDSLRPDASAAHPGDPLGSGAASDRIHHLVVASREYNDSRLEREFHDGWTMLGPLHFLTRMAIPFMRELGDCWQTGCVDVANEHFASERLCDFLASRWRSMNREAIYSPIIVAGLPKDRHRAALLMASVVITAARHRVIYLGAETPVRDLVQAFEHSGAEGICLPISPSITQKATARYLAELTERVPREVPIITGGRGAPPPTGRVKHLDDFVELYQLLRVRQEEQSSQPLVGTARG